MSNKTALKIISLNLFFLVLMPTSVFADEPEITIPTDIMAEATSTSGASVTFSVTAVDTDGVTVTPICAPLSGSLFALGTTTVACVATSLVNSASTTQASFNVTVVDTIPPVIIPPADQIFATTTLPAFPTLVYATATDTVDANPSISSDAPASFSAGTTTITWTATDASGNSSATTSNVIITQEETAQIAIRDGSTLIGPFTITLPSSSASPISLSPTGTTTSYSVPARSVLAQLSSLDAFHSEFDITDLQYFSSFSSFIVNCISVPSASATPDCFNWTYAVNGAFPFFGMDGYTLQNGDTAYIFFGSQWQVSTDKAAVLTDESFTVTAQKYDPSSGAYVSVAGETVGAVQFDPNFTVTEFATSTTDANGQATLSVSVAGSYSVGIAGSGYFPNTPVTVSAPAPAPSGSGGGSGVIIHYNIDTDKAFEFLSTHQKENGSFGADLYTDWAAIAFGAGETNEGRNKITAYLKSSPNMGTSITDFERRAMALLALGINPYNGTDTDYIKKITDSFDGAQIGSSSLVNDDIFAIFPLIKSGYAESDSMIQKIVAFILSKQNTNGSWEGSVDLTAAAVQALALTPSFPGVSEAKTKARSYLLVSQQNDGGFGNSSFATSWTTQAIYALGEEPSGWQKNNNTPGDFLHSFQQSDGGVEPSTSDENTRVWATAYAIPAGLNKPWASILLPFSRPESSVTSQTGSVLIPEVTGETATSTLESLISLKVSTSTATTTVTILAATTTQQEISLPKISIISKNDSRKKEPVNPEKKIPTIQLSAENNQQAAVSATPGANTVSVTIKVMGKNIANAISSFVKDILSVFKSMRM